MCHRDRNAFFSQLYRADSKKRRQSRFSVNGHFLLPLNKTFLVTSIGKRNFFVIWIILRCITELLCGKHNEGIYSAVGKSSEVCVTCGNASVVVY